MTCLKFALLILLLYVVKIRAGIPQTKLEIAGSTLKDLVKVDLINLIKIPDQKFKKGKVTNIKVIEIFLPDIKITEIGSILRCEFTNFGIRLSANWNINFKIVFVRIKASGTLNVSAKGIDIILTLDKKTFKVKTCKDSIKTLDVKFEGKDLAGNVISFLANTFKRPVSRRLKKELKGKICKAVTKLINDNAPRITDILG